jgi:hypothetical protein
MKISSLPVAAALLLGPCSSPAEATDSCVTYQSGHVYYVAYQNLPAGQEYIVDLGSKDLFLNANDRITFPDVVSSDFSTFFSGTTPNLWVGFFGVRNPATRDGILSANGPVSDTQLNNSSMVGAANQVDSWATGLPSFASEVGAPCHLNAGSFPGRVFGSYQDTLNGFSQGSLSGNLIWNVETRLSSSTGVRTAPPKIRFYSAINNPGQGIKSRQQIGYFDLFTDGSIDYFPDFDGDLLPDVAIGSDPNADKCPGVNDPNNTDVDGDNHGVPCDCNDADATSWAIPDEIVGDAFNAAKTTYSWNPPAVNPGTSLKYDVFRAVQSGAVTTPTWACYSPDLLTASLVDATTPTVGQRFLYLVRAQTNCGAGTVGSGSPSAPPRTVPSCP